MRPLLWGAIGAGVAIVALELWISYVWHGEEPVLGDNPGWIERNRRVAAGTGGGVVGAVLAMVTA